MLGEPTAVSDRWMGREMRESFYRSTAEAIVEEAGGDVPLAAGMIELAEAETHMAEYVLEGRCLDGRWKCDRNPRTGRPMAQGPWQVWPWCRQAHALATRMSALELEVRREEARCAGRRLRGGLGVCRGWAGAFSYFRRGRCGEPFGAKRAEDRARLEAALYRELASSGG